MSKVQTHEMGETELHMESVARALNVDSGARSFLRIDPLLRLSLETTKKYLSLRAKNDEQAASDLVAIEEASSKLAKIRAAHNEAKHQDISAARRIAKEYYGQEQVLLRLLSAPMED